MSFTLFTDCSSNLPGNIVRELDIHILPCSYLVEQETVSYDGNLETFDAKAYYDLLREGKRITTSLLNTGLFLEHFRPELEQGRDVVYVGMSSGISGTLHSAQMAAEELSGEFPNRQIRIVDSLGAGLGTGLLTCMAADLRRDGLDADEAARRLDEARMGLCEFFTVDDLHYLKRTGRINAATAVIGSVLNIKPILYGDNEGHIVSCGKARGRKKVMDALVERYAKKAVDPRHSRVAISHGDCPEEAEELARRVRAVAEPGELIICPHEPFTGAHVGPGMLALFFFGNSR